MNFIEITPRMLDYFYSLELLLTGRHVWPEAPLGNIDVIAHKISDENNQ